MAGVIDFPFLSFVGGLEGGLEHEHSPPTNTTRIRNNMLVALVVVDSRPCLLQVIYFVSESILVFTSLQ